MQLCDGHGATWAPGQALVRVSVNFSTCRRQVVWRAGWSAAYHHDDEQHAPISRRTVLAAGATSHRDWPPHGDSTVTCLDRLSASEAV
jgi:hypothetical protein